MQRFQIGFTGIWCAAGSKGLSVGQISDTPLTYVLTQNNKLKELGDLSEMFNSMTHLQTRQLWLVIFFCTVNSACVSVNLGNKNQKKSDYVRYRSPSSPYKDIRIESSDFAWQNNDNGTTLSYLSVCNDPADPSLDSMKTTSLRGFDSLVLNSDEEMTYNERLGKKVSADGTLDGVPVTIRLLVFKRNFCSYTISMVGVKKNFNSTDQTTFDNFIGSFKTP